MSCSSSQTAPASVSSTGDSPSGIDCFCMGLHGKVLPAKLLQRGVLFPLVCRFCQNPALTLAAHSLVWASICTSLGFSRVCRWIFAPLWTFTGCRSTATLTTVFTTSFKGICSNTWSTSSLSFPTEPSVCRVACLTCSHYSLLWLQLLLPCNFLPLLKYVFPVPLPLMSSVLASARPVLELAGIGLARHKENLPPIRCWLWGRGMLLPQNYINSFLIHGSYSLAFSLLG